MTTSATTSVIKNIAMICMTADVPGIAYLYLHQVYFNHKVPYLVFLIIILIKYRVYIGIYSAVLLFKPKY